MLYNTKHKANVNREDNTMIYFKTRSQARNFAKKNPDKYKVVDLGISGDYRWGVQVLAKKAA